MSDLTVSLIQANLHWEDVAANLAMFDQKINSIQERTEVIILPEMFSTGFSMQSERLAQTMDGSAVQWMKQKAKEKNVIITDLRGLRDLPPGNRFLIYTMFPDANIQVRIFDGRGGEFTVCAVGHSIFNRTSKTDVGQLMDKYGGGGHKGAGTCQLPNAHAEAKIRDIIEAIKADG